MPIDQKEVFEYLGIKEVPENLEAFRKSFDTAYIKKSPDVIKEDSEFYGKIMAEKAGSITTKFRRELKEMGVDFAKAEAADKPAEEVIEMGLRKAKEYFSTKIADLEGQAGKGNDERISALQTQLEKAQTKASDFEALAKKAAEEGAAKEQAWATEKKGIKKQVKFGEAIKAIKWKSGIKDIEKKGYFATFDEKYTVDLDDNDNPEVFDKSGKRIPSGKESGKFLSLEQALENHGRETEVWETNPHAERGRVIPTNFTQMGQPGNGQATGQPAPGRMLSAAALKAEGK